MLSNVVVVALASAPGLFFVGTLVRETESELIVTSVARAFETQSETGRLGYQWHPDPWFTVEGETRILKAAVMMIRVIDGEDRMAMDYERFLTQIRLKKSGLVSGVQDLEAQKKILSTP